MLHLFAEIFCVVIGAAGLVVGGIFARKKGVLQNNILSALFPVVVTFLKHLMTSDEAEIIYNALADAINAIGAEAVGQPEAVVEADILAAVKQALLAFPALPAIADTELADLISLVMTLVDAIQ
jgi:hypothetical protein